MRTLSGPADGFDLDAQSFTEPTSGATDTLQWIVSDHLASASVTANADGTWNSTIQYTAFGEVRASKGVTATRYRYTGQLAQDSLGLDYYVARWYDPVIGHFVSSDPIVPSPKIAAAYDRYSYVLNNPILMIDPNGHRPSGRCEDAGGCEESEVEKAQAQKNAELNTVRNSEENGCKYANCNRGLEILIFGTGGLVGSAVAMTVVSDLAIMATTTSVTTTATSVETANAACGFDSCIDEAEKASQTINEAATTVQETLPKFNKTIEVIDKGRTVNQFLSDASKFIGDEYNQIRSGIYRSADGLRQVRFTERDLLPTHSRDLGPHGHFELLNSMGEYIKNIHIPLIDY